MSLPGWAIGAIAGVLVLGGSHWLAYSTGADQERARQQLAIAGTSNAALVVARSIETAQAVATVEAVQSAQSDLSAVPDLRPELDRVRDANARLRRELSDASSAAGRGETATRAAMVLSELLDRAAARNVELAGLYDGALIRGRLCEQLSDQWRAAQLGNK